MISQDILTALKGYAQRMTKDVSFILQLGRHDKREELISFLSDVCSVSERLSFEERDIGLRSAVSFALAADGEPTGIEFSGIPGGHEFNSLILAMLRAGGTDIKLDDAVQKIIASIEEDLHFEMFVSLDCHNCPDVVQALHQFALLNPRIRSEMIDGGLFQDTVEDRDIQGVPTIHLNGELFSTGRAEPAGLVEKLQKKFPRGMRSAETFIELPIQDVTVIGGGPAGVSAAIYAARKGIRVSIVAERFGGQVKDTMGIENLISIPQTTGPELVGALHQHMSDYEITLKEHVSVSEVRDEGDIKKVVLSTGETILTRTLIVATGARWRELGIPGEKENVGKGVAYCPHCDGPFFKGKDVAVIGGGNSGIEAALDLASIVRRVTVFEFLPNIKADKVLIDQINKRRNIEVLTNVATSAIEATSGKVSSIRFQHRDTDEEDFRNLEGVFVQIGLLPNSQCVSELVEVTRQGEIIIDDKCRTSVAGVYACGDVTTVPYKQIVVSIGEGAKAALAAFEYLLTESSIDEVQVAETTIG